MPTMATIPVINTPIEKAVLEIEKINEISTVLKYCDNDCGLRLASLSHKISVLENNLHVMPSLKDGLDNMKNEVCEIQKRRIQINNALEITRLNIY